MFNTANDGGGKAANGLMICLALAATVWGTPLPIAAKAWATISITPIRLNTH